MQFDSWAAASDPALATPPSRARLMAESLFAPRPPVPDTGPPVVVTFRRSRTSLPADGESLETQADSAEAKAPRVFRIDTLAVSEELDVPAPVVVAEETTLPRRTRRVDATRRPSAAVVQRFEIAPPTVEVAVPAAPDEQARALRAQLAALEPVFAEIRRAMAWRFTDHSGAATWQRLALRAQELQAALTRL